MMFLRKKKRKLTRIPKDRLLIRATVQTDTGCVRENNEDNAAFLFLEGSKTDFLAILADGMGGYERGEVASAIMVDTFCSDNGQTLGKKPKQWLSGLLNKANSLIYEQSQQLQSVMGTTCTTLLIRDRKIYCAHIGDSRMYLLAGDIFRQVTCDHTIVMELLKKGQITAEEAAIHPQRNLLTKAAGTKPHITPDVFKIKFPIRVGNRFLLCSDGLYDLVTDVEIHQHLAMESIREAAASLIALAKERGGYDNITVAIVEINEKTDTEE
ncbi:MAG: Stp1/IreP family PP2C-type Ser/Thr phosphatase [Bacteroidales bacterium]|jgi:protein phosphatase|nr:Stp1/IreP family PP2C-type Ser/Thr phosphatase [Bacteroidales bacterium]